MTPDDHQTTPEGHPDDLPALSDDRLVDLIRRAELTRDRIEPLRWKRDEAVVGWVEARELVKALERELTRRVSADLDGLGAP